MNATASTESALFQAAARLQPDQRAAYLRAACGDNEPLRRELESLLAAHQPEASFMLSAAAVTIDHALAEAPGTVIGGYKLLQQIGEGGMGVVFMAEQEHPVRRRVALKIIKPGMDSRQVIARFEAERQALAMMDHQHIARVLDAGTTESGRPFFVMELVHGVPLTKYCDDNRLTLQQRLELFVPVCQAIQHAHQKGVIHRDIKPSNILVTMYDDKPVPKVIDFGVAKAVEQRLTEKTLFTQYGMLVGTFEYMSPEQAEMNAYGVDTRSDVYALGVLLYELLTGTTPIERDKLREAALVELVRLIRDEEPPRPSIRLSTLGNLPKVAAACRSEPGQLPKMLRGELDWIVMKCLEKDRTRRYETVNGLARDVQRYLNKEPVEACPPSAFYRFRKLWHKHRGVMATAASIGAILVVACIVSSVLAAWAFQSQRQANEALASERIARQEAVTAKVRADRAALRLREAIQTANDGIDYFNRKNWFAAHERFTKAASIEPELNTPYAYRGALYVTLGLWDQAAADYDRRFELASRADAQTCFEYALLKVFTGDEGGYRQACNELIRQHGHSAEIVSRFAVLRSCLLTPRPVGDPGELLRRADALVTGAYSPWHLGIAGRAALLAGQYEQAEAHCREALQIGAGSPQGVHRVTYPTLAMSLHRQGKTREAEQILSRARQARDEWIEFMLDGLVGTTPFSWWDCLEFELMYREATVLVTGAPPVDDPRLVALYDRGLAAISRGDVFVVMDAGREEVNRQAWEAAAANFVKVLDQLPPGFRSSSQEMRFCIEMVQQPEVFERLVAMRPNDRRLWHARGQLLASRRQWTEAIADYAITVEMLRQELQASTENKTAIRMGLADALQHLGALRLLAGDQAGYRELCETIVNERTQADSASEASLLSRTCTLLGDGLADWAVPLDLARQAIDEHPRVAWHLYALGIALFRAGNHEAAVQTLKRSLEIRPNWMGRSQNHLVLALACHRLDRIDEARQWLQEARTALNQADRQMATSKFGFAASNYLSDWLCTLVLLAEAEKVLESE